MVSPFKSDLITDTDNQGEICIMPLCGVHPAHGTRILPDFSGSVDGDPFSQISYHIVKEITIGDFHKIFSEFLCKRENRKLPLAPPEHLWHSEFVGLSIIEKAPVR